MYEAFILGRSERVKEVGIQIVLSRERAGVLGSDEIDTVEGCGSNFRGVDCSDSFITIH